MSSSNQQLLSQISLVLTSISNNNNNNNNNSQSSFSVWPFQNKPRSIFTNKQQQSTSIQQFLSFLDRETDSLCTIYIFALCLLQKLEDTKAFTRLNSNTVHGIFWTCFVIAFKFLEDEVYTDNDFSRLGAIDVSQLIQMELHYLKALKFNATVTQEEIKTMNTKLTQIWFSQSKTETIDLLNSITRVSDLFQMTSEDINKISSTSKTSIYSSSSSSPSLSLSSPVTTKKSVFPFLRKAQTNPQFKSHTNPNTPTSLIPKKSIDNVVQLGGVYMVY